MSILASGEDLVSGFHSIAARSMLLSDVRFVYAEGLNMGAEAAAAGHAQAQADIDAALA